MEADKNVQFLLAELEGSNGENGGDLKKAAKKVKQSYKTVEENHDSEMELAWDDVSGASLDPKAVKAARAEEINYVKKMGLYIKVLVSERLKQTGHRPISVRWIDINKGDKD